MTTQNGTSLALFKAALLVALNARPKLVGVMISDDPPQKPDDLKSDTGLFEAIHLANAHWTELKPSFLGVPVTFDETYELDAIIQVLKTGPNGGSQAEADSRACELLGELWAALAADPVVGLANATNGVTMFFASPSSADHLVIDPLQLGGGDQHGSRFDLKIAVEARLQLF